MSRVCVLSTTRRNSTVTNVQIIKVSSTQLDFNLLAPLGCGLSTGASAVINVANLKQGQSIAVFGLGAVGMVCSKSSTLTPS